MRYKPEQKEETRLKMIKAASQSFRRHGFSGIGVDGLAKAAGVTSGAFYTHFGSKNAAFDAAIDAGLNEVIAGVPKFQADHGSQWVQAFSEYYLGKPHRDDLSGGCAMASLTSEIIRSESPVHKAYEKKMILIAELMAEGLDGGSAQDRIDRAWAILCTLVGGLNIARAMNSSVTIDAVARATIAATVAAAGETRA